MTAFLLAFTSVMLIVAIAGALFVVRTGRDMAWFRQMLADKLARPSPIPSTTLAELDHIFESHSGLPAMRAEVSMVGGPTLGGTSDTESWILSALSKRSTRMFEFGTATGRTSYHWARNSPPHAKVVTLTLSADEARHYEPGAQDSPTARNNALFEGVTTFCYSGTDVEEKITQLYGDSKAFDETPYTGCMDLVFIDGSHAFSYVRNDSEKALRIVGPRGLIVWHDYRPGPDTGDVKKYLDNLAATLPLRRIPGTTLVAYRAKPRHE